MNRTIKFRALDKETNQMLSDVCTNTDDFTDMLNETFALWLTQNLILMQFTGLLDKNGKEIYQGDIFSMFGGTQKSEIFWDDCGMWAIKLIPSGESIIHTDLVANHLKIGEVIGNIYQNPELLK